MKTNNQHGPEALRFQGAASQGQDETLRVLVRDYRYAAYDVGARGKGSGRGDALEAAEAALLNYLAANYERKPEAVPQGQPDPRD